MPNNSLPSLLDSGQIIKRAYDETLNRIRVDAVIDVNGIGGQEIVISHLDDSIRLGNGVNFLTTSIVGPSVGLDVNLIGGVVSGQFSPTGLSKGLKQTVMVITDTPTKIPSNPLVDRNGMSVRIWGSNTVYFGNSSLTSATGYPKRQYEEMVLDVKDNSLVELYAICDAGMTCEVRILEIA